MQPVPMIKNDSRVQKLPFAAAEISIFCFAFLRMDIPPVKIGGKGPLKAPFSGSRKL